MCIYVAVCVYLHFVFAFWFVFLCLFVCVPATSPAFIACKLFDRSHSDWHEMVSHCGFDLHFSDNE